MGKKTVLALALGALMAVGVAGLATARGDRPTTVVRAGNMVLTIGGGVSPTTLPKVGLAPVGLSATTSFSTADGSQPPALRRVELDSDSDVVVDVSGLPTCRKGQLESRDSDSAIRACPRAVLGRGKASVSVAFAEQSPFTSTGPLVLFNGGVKGGVTTLYIHAYVSVPAPTAVVSTAKLTRIDKGPYGFHTEFTIPPIAGGNASVISGELTARRVYMYKGERHSVFAARCSDGRIQAHGKFEFADGSSISGGIIEPCKAV